MTLENIYKNESCSPTQEENLGYYFQSETCPGALETHIFRSFLWSVVCKRPVINVTLITLKYQQKNTFQLDININYKHVICTSALQSYLCYIFYEIADNNLKDWISD